MATPTRSKSLITTTVGDDQSRGRVIASGYADKFWMMADADAALICLPLPLFEVLLGSWQTDVEANPIFAHELRQRNDDGGCHLSQSPGCDPWSA